MKKRASLSSKQISNIISKGSETNFIDLTEAGADKESLRILKESLQNQSTKTFTTLDLYGNKFGDEGLNEIIPMVEMFPSITVLKLEFNGITSVGAQMLVDWLKKYRGLKELNLYENRKIGDAGATAFANLISSGTTLENIDLFGCGITDVGAKAIAKSMRNNKTLRKLELNGNEISEKYMEQVEAILLNNQGQKVDVPDEVVSPEQQKTEEKISMSQTQPKPKLVSTSCPFVTKAEVDWDKEKDYLQKKVSMLEDDRKHLLISLLRDQDYTEPKKTPINSPKLKKSHSNVDEILSKYSIPTTPTEK
jgi:hypothetical protein